MAPETSCVANFPNSHIACGNHHSDPGRAGIMLDRILQLSARGVDFPMNTYANDAKTAGPGLFSTTALSRMSDFATGR
jgi:hypothetical protein